MKKETKRDFCMAAGLLAAFALWTVSLRIVDVQAIGPQKSMVGFGTINQFVHNLTGVNMVLYRVTDWLSLVPLGIVIGFAGLGLVQWGQRKSLRRVDDSLFVLGGFYCVVLAAYVFFELVVINYRPVLIEGALEVSYPSSTTVLVLCVMPTAIRQLKKRTKDGAFQRRLTRTMAAFAALMVVGRLLSGVHWFTDIVGGVLLSSALVRLYRAACGLREPPNDSSLA